jgi:hypothetical protein
MARRTYPSPGWYPDPDGGTDLRYWNGEAWTDARRPRPTWIGGEPAAAVSVPQPAAPDDDASPAPNRRRWWFLAGAAVLAAMALILAEVAIGNAKPGPRVLTDKAFIAQANQTCATSLNKLRPAPADENGKPKTNAQVADQIDTAADGIGRLADDLARLPAAAVDQPHIDGWLADWRLYASIGHQYADAVRSGTAKQRKQLATDGEKPQQRADNFSRANALSRCSFFAVPRSTGAPI